MSKKIKFHEKFIDNMICNIVTIAKFIQFKNLTIAHSMLNIFGHDCVKMKVCRCVWGLEEKLAPWSSDSWTRDSRERAFAALLCVYRGILIAAPAMGLNTE